MRTTQPGKWWVLSPFPGLYFTGALTRAPIGAALRELPVYSMDPKQAQQIRDRAGAVFIASLFGLAREVEPVEMEFAE